MKEKRYFCDWCEKLLISKKFCLIVVALCIISSIIVYSINHSKFIHEVYSFSKSDYEYLNEVVFDVCDKDIEAINFSAIPDNVKIANMDFNKNTLSFTCILDRGFTVIPNPRVYVSVSDNIEKIQIKTLSEKEVTDSSYITSKSIPIGCLIILIPITFLFIPYQLSLKKKEKDSMKENMPPQDD